MPWYDQPTRFGPSRRGSRGYISLVVIALGATTGAQASTGNSTATSTNADATEPNQRKKGNPFVSIATTSANVSIQVSRSESTLDCPDATQIRDALTKHSVGNPTGELGLAISFQKSGAASVATIFASGAKSGARELRLETRDCQALLDPIVVSLTLLLDPDPERMKVAASEPTDMHTEHEDAASADGTSTEARPKPMIAPIPFARAEDQQNEPSPSAPRDYGFAIDIGPTLIAGLIPRVGYGVEAQAAAFYRALSLRIAAAGLAAEQLTYGDAQLRGHTYFARVGLCAQTKWRQILELSLCQATWIGQFSVEAHGLATDRSSSPLFLAFGSIGEAGVALAGPLGAYLRAGAFAPISQHRFNVDGFAGPVFQSQAFGAWLGTGVSWKFL